MKLKSMILAPNIPRTSNTPRLACCAGDFMPRSPVNANGRQRALFDNDRKWVSGTTLTYAFFDGPDEYKAALVRAMEEWMSVCSISFIPAPMASAKIRIGFEQDGAWSYLGRDILTISPSERTMNIGWNPISDFDMALHEVGHTLALHHEHQHHTGIEWDRDAVIADLSGPPNNWNIGTIESNVLNSVPRESITGTEIVDPHSIMMYPIPGHWIKGGQAAGVGFNPDSGLSAGDRYWASIVYPELNPPVDPVDPDDPVAPPEDPPLYSANIEVDVVLNCSEQNKLRFKVPNTGDYVVGTKGSADTVCVLFEDGVQIGADDDSGTDFNAKIEAVLQPHKVYELVTRLYWQRRTAPLTVVVKPKE